MMGLGVLGDWIVCTGLGIAFASVFFSVLAGVDRIARSTVRDAWKELSRWGLFLIALPAFLGIAAVIGATRLTRSEDSVLGFCFGALIACTLAFVIHRLPKAADTASSRNP